METRLLDGDLVNFHVTMRGARNQIDVEAYAECAAAQYALIRGYGFARHLRTNVDEEGGLWRGDAVYTISPALPRGSRTIDAEVTALACAENGIPMV
ncbi:lipoprotein, putative [Sagittula stellata E-37]|uniref:Lipoprotein, putative n=1 Tax=Sagittula stellata (strain ATCC 700073 / DSM 11524 / E-37) TaxID=388399 RepID=A3K1E0_SAGS3|nr:lipoprotein, putative [Sagittula stellata E-37]